MVLIIFITFISHNYPFRQSWLHCFRVFFIIIRCYITITWASGHLNSPSPGMFVEQFVEADVKGDIKASRYCLLWGESTRNRWISLTKGQYMMRSSNGNIFRVIGPVCEGIHRSPVHSVRKGQWRGALMVSLICAWTNGSANNRGAGDLRRDRAHYDVTLISQESVSMASRLMCRALTL